MTTRLLDIYTAIANIPVLAGGSLAKAYALSSLPASLPSGDLPARLVLPMSPGQAAAVAPLSLHWVRGSGTAAWRIVDLMLLTPASQSNFTLVAPQLISYEVAYLEAVTFLKLPSSTCTLTSVSFEVGIYSYAGTEYYGVEAALSILEILR